MTFKNNLGSAKGPRLFYLNLFLERKKHGYKFDNSKV